MTFINGWALLKQVLLATCASLGYMTIGLVRGYSSPGLPSMHEKNPHLVPNENIDSWISAVPPLGAFLGSLLSGPMMEHIGRKRALMVSAPFFSMSWIFIALSNNWQLLICSRAFSGVCVGTVLPSAQIYVSECCHPKVRGMMGSLPSLFLAVGILVAYVAGTWLAWDYLAYLCATFPAIMFFLLIPLPESPAWLHLHGKADQAKLSKQWLQLELTQSQLQNRQTDGQDNKKLFSVEVMKPFGLVVFCLILQQTSGIDVIIFYTVSIFQTSGSVLSDHGSTVTVGVVQLVATVVALFLVDKYGRKLLLIISGVLMGVSMLSLGTYFRLKESGISSTFNFVPLVSLLIFTVGYSVGFSNVPFILMGELLPMSRRSLLSAISGSANLGATFLVIKTYPDLKMAMGSHGTFWLYSSLCFISSVFVWFYLPETKGKTFQEIEAIFEMKPKVMNYGTTTSEVMEKNTQTTEIR